MERATIYALGLLSLCLVVRAIFTLVLHPAIRSQVYGSEPCLLFATSFECRIIRRPSGKHHFWPLLRLRRQWCDWRTSQVPLHFADKIGALNVEIPFTLVASMLGFAWIAVQDTAGIFVFSVVYGFFAGAITTVTAVIDAALCPSLDVVGVRMGMLLLPWAFGLLVGEPIAGAILSSSSSWKGLQIFTGTVIGAAVLIAVAVRYAKYGSKLITKC